MPRSFEIGEGLSTVGLQDPNAASVALDGDSRVIGAEDRVPRPCCIRENLRQVCDPWPCITRHVPTFDGGLGIPAHLVPGEPDRRWVREVEEAPKVTVWSAATTRW